MSDTTPAPFMVLTHYPLGGGAPQQLRIEADAHGPLAGILPLAATLLPGGEQVNLAAYAAAAPCRRAVLTGPQGVGKSLLAQPLMVLLGLARVLDEGWGDLQPQDGVLLISDRIPGEAAA